jgi:hypothetical protein
LTHNLLKPEAEKMKNYENLALKIKNIWSLNNVSVYTLYISAKGMVTRSFQKYLGLTKNIIKVKQRAVLLHMYHTVSKFLEHAL